MKLKDLVEVKLQHNYIDVREPSGVASPTNVDPDNFPMDGSEDEDQKDRSKGLRRKYKLEKNMRKTKGSGVKVQGDSEDMTGSGANSAVNGGYRP